MGFLEFFFSFFCLWVLAIFVIWDFFIENYSNLVFEDLLIYLFFSWRFPFLGPSSRSGFLSWYFTFFSLFFSSEVGFFTTGVAIIYNFSKWVIHNLMFFFLLFFFLTIFSCVPFCKMLLDLPFSLLAVCFSQFSIYIEVLVFLIFPPFFCGFYTF